MTIVKPLPALPAIPESRVSWFNGDYIVYIYRGHREPSAVPLVAGCRVGGLNMGSIPEKQQISYL